MPFEFEKLDIPGLVLIRPQAFADERGVFMETYRHSDFAAAGIADRFVQSNVSYSKRGVLRGLHYQKQPKAQAKLVHVVAGEIYDVVVDLREDSPSFGRWYATVLSAENGRMLYVPPWCAHGFCVLSEEARVAYSVTEEYSPELERGILWSDPALAISWPVEAPIVSPKDQALPLFAAADLDAAWPDPADASLPRP